ncbi:MAG: NAD(P)-dependent oxidoreductase, partial [SAR324 cluster bacterium]|nr:NAD(P)-dependent oxidoreductase [SAR324 cluster bacterium]
MKILLTGGEGMLEQDFLSVLDQFPEFECYVPTRKELDITNQEQVEGIIKNYRPDILLNCAAYTKVDKAETESARAFLVNGISVGKLAEACHRSGVKFVHLSTDFVFDGSNRSPVTESNPTAPLGIYGKSKRGGEERIEASAADWLTVRTSWLFASHGNNFVRT